MPAYTAGSTEVAQLRTLLERRPTIAIVTHHNPDGDAVGSSLGLAHVLRAMGHTVQVVFPNRPPAHLQWMPGMDTALCHDEDRAPTAKLVANSDLVMVLDLNRSDRVGGLEQAVKDARMKVLIDHHRDPEDMAQVMFSRPEVCATCELIYDIVLALDADTHLDRAAATCLYTGIVTDTGSFRFPSTSPHTMRVAAALMERGIDHAAVHGAVHDAHSFDRMRLLGYALQEKMQLLPGVPGAIIGLAQQELERFHFRPGDTEGFVNQPLSIAGMRLSVLAIERNNEVKLSFRSKGPLPVDQFARIHFDGGGHANAAGGRSTEPLDAVLAKLQQLLPPFIQAHPA